MIEQKPIDWRDYFEGPFTLSGTTILAANGGMIAASYSAFALRTSYHKWDTLESITHQVAQVICAALTAEWEKGREL